tara:strand:- start:284 stop:472 length:189 start_codon:yes stop_codon:yes gene_type:complete
LNRVAPRLVNLAEIKAQVGYKRRPGRYGGKPAMITENKVAQNFDAAAPNQVWVTRYHLHLYA